jgi:ribonucleoside-triphosphate reductase
LIAGEVSKDISARLLLPEHLSQAHKNGEIHFHDMDYYIQDMFNCCLVNVQDMLDNGTVMNEKMIESPKSFQVACTIVTQIIAANSSGQFGGQSLSLKHLGKYLKKTEEKQRKKLMEKF